MPVYKGDVPAHFDLALKSVSQQTYRAKEILVVQDGPITPELEQVLAYWQDLDPTIKTVILDRNQGLSAALNAGIVAAQYEWIARMDADDICKLDRFEKQVHYINCHKDLAIVGSWIQEFDEQMSEVLDIRKLPETHEEILKYAKWRCPFNHMTVMYKKSVIVSLGMYKTFKDDNNAGFGEDYELWARFLVKGYKAANLQEVLVDARTGKDFFSKRRRGMKYLKNEIKEISDLKELGLINHFQWLIHVAIKSFVRLSPPFVVKGVYKILRLTS